MGAGLFEFRDLDIMFRVAEHGADGLTAGELAEALGIRSETAAQAVGVRSSWMRSYGFLAYEPERKLWRLSDSGDRVVEAQLAASKIAEPELPESEVVVVAAQVAAHLRHADPTTAALIRREVAYAEHVRRFHRNGRRR